MNDSHLQYVLKNYQSTGFIADEIFPILADETRSCMEYKVKVDVMIRDRANTDPIFIRQLEEGRAMHSMDALYLDWEIRMAKLFASVPAFYEPVVSWTDYGKSRPYGDIVNRSVDVDGPPTHVLMSGTAWRDFRRNIEVIEMCGRSDGLYPSPLPSLHQIEDLLHMKVLVGNAWINESEDDSMNLTAVWGDNVYLYHIPETPDLETPSFGYCIRSQPIRVERLPYDTRRHVRNIEITLSQDEIIVDKTMCAAIRNTMGAPEKADD